MHFCFLLCLSPRTFVGASLHFLSFFKLHFLLLHHVSSTSRMMTSGIILWLIPFREKEEEVDVLLLFTSRSATGLRHLRPVGRAFGTRTALAASSSPGKHRPTAWPVAWSLWSTAGLSWGHRPQSAYTRWPLAPSCRQPLHWLSPPPGKIFSFFPLAAPRGLQISVFRPGIEPASQQWKPRILTTRQPGNFYPNFLLIAFLLLLNTGTN